MNIRFGPELVGLIKLIGFLETTEFYKGLQRVAIIIDTELGKINEFNARKLPIFGSIFLPKRMQLTYASADVGAELLSNQLIRSADKSATICLEELESGRAELNSKEIEGALYSGFRKIILRSEPKR